MLSYFQASLIATVGAVGFYFVMVMGMFDFSIGANIMLSAIVGCVFASRFGMGYAGLIIGSVLTGTIVGLLNGIFYVKLRIPSMIVTTGLALIYESVANYIAGGVEQTLPSNLRAFGQMPWNIILALLACVAAYIFLNYTKIGTYTYAIGSNEFVAKNMGINVNKYKVLAFILSGAFLGVMAILTISYGSSMVAVTGMASMSRNFVPTMGCFFGLAFKKYGMPLQAIVIGEFVINIIFFGFIAMGAPTAIQDVITGLALLIIITLTTKAEKRRDCQVNRGRKCNERGKITGKNLCKSFGITKAVQNVSFNVNKGEVHALIGENGSGKSTLTNMLTGIYSIGSGTFILDGKEIHPKNQVEANNEGVSIIVQELGTLSGLTVAENIFLGHEDQFVHMGIKNTNAMNKKATELLKQYGFERIKAADIIDNYNFEDRKLVEIVKATYFNPKIVVIDETTTALSQEGREELYKHMNRIRESGNTVIFISHDLPEILEKSDTITILRDGVYIDTVKSKDVTEDDLKRLMVGREVTGDYYRADYGEKVSDEVVLSVKNVTVPGLIEDVSFDLHKGEILGFGGLSESGMHEIGKAIFGASYDRTGTVQLADGTQINDIPGAIKHSIAYTSKDRDNESVVLNQSIGDNICLPSLDSLANKLHLLSDKKLREFSNQFAKQMSVKMVNVNQFVSELSGGNKQKVVLARWIEKIPILSFSTVRPVVLISRLNRTFTS